MSLTFDHIAQCVPDIKSALQFYREQFPQFELLYEDETWALIRLGILKLAFVLEEHHPPHMAFRVDSRERLGDIAYKAGATIKIHRDASESFYINDPGGNALEIIWYPQKS